MRNERRMEQTKAMLDLTAGEELIADCHEDACCGMNDGL